MTISSLLILSLIAVESGGDPNAIGDDGLAFGVLQMHAGYVADAAAWAGEDWVHEDAFDPDKSIKIFNAYMARYATPARLGREVTAEDIARIHNGGPNGWRKNSTLSYWKKVKINLKKPTQNKMELITKEIKKLIPEIGSQSNKNPSEIIGYVKLFAPWSNWTWWIAEYDTNSGDCFGYVEGMEAEFGFFNVNELAEVKGPFDLKIERDRLFLPTKILQD